MEFQNDNDRWNNSINPITPQKNNSKLHKSNGINPLQFHNVSSPKTNEIKSHLLSTITPKRKKQFEKHIQEILHKSYQRCINLQCQDWYHQTIKLRRNVFREMSFLKTFPLQELAMKEYQYQMDIHQNKIQQPSKETLSSTSSSSYDEQRQNKHMKRQKDPLIKDVSTNTEKSRYQMEFKMERNIASNCHPSNVQYLTIQDPINHSPNLKTTNTNKVKFLSPLWSMEPRIFAIELSKTGKRKYVVGSYGRIADTYWRKVSPFTRHYYELIKEDTPCRLYFDLEFCTQSNPDISPTLCERILDELFLELSHQLHIIYPTIPKITRSSIVDLDSSTLQKFSRHWIVHLPNHTLFANTNDMGKFVKYFVGQLAEQIATGTLQDKRPVLSKYLFINAKQNSTHANTTTCIIDLGVYTRNRLFRLLGASKYGKSPSAALRIAKTNQFPFPNGFDNDKFYFPSLEQKKGNDNDKSIMDSLEKEIIKFRSKMDWSMHAEALAQTLVIPLNSSKIDFPILTNPEILQTLDLPLSQKNEIKNHSHSSKHSSNNTTTMGPSPFPSLDNYVNNILGKRGGGNGCIRAWIMDLSFAKEAKSKNEGPVGTITFQMIRNRYCEHIQRQHKSNNIMWTVNLHTFQCWQSCYDSECHATGFRGFYVDLPDNVIASIKDVLFDMEISQLDENQWITQTNTNDPFHTSKISKTSNSLKPPNTSNAFNKSNISNTSYKSKITYKSNSSITNDDISNPWDDDTNDDEFEKALLQLNISITEEAKPSTSQIESKTDTTAIPQIKDVIVTLDDSNEIDINNDWDDAMMKALETNPNFFP